MQKHQSDDVRKFPKGARVKYFPRSGYGPYGKGPGARYLDGEVLGHIQHTRDYLGPQVLLVYFQAQNKTMRVKAYKLELNPCN